MKLFTKTFGCQMNFADSDEMGRHLKKRGYTPAAEVEEADAVLVNTCTVRDLAEHKASSYLGLLKEWKAEHPQGTIILTGCAAERAKSEFKRRFPYIDLIVGAKDIESFPQELDDLLQQRVISEEDLVPAIQRQQEGPAVQYVTIMRGCNYNCTYCIVPSVRGREIYLPVDKILQDVRDRVAEGAKEVWLLGQTVNSYRPAKVVIPAKAGIQALKTSGSPTKTFGDDESYDFADLLRDINNVEGLKRIRFMSPHPYYLTPKLIRAMSESDKSCEHLHLPVQSGSNAMLKKMKRNYTRESYLEGIRKLREEIPSIALSTDLIVGFPGETDDDFNATLSLVEEAGFDSAYCFKYSPRPGTVSAEWEDDIPEEVKESRVNKLLELVDRKGAEKVKSLIGTIQEVLIEDDKGEGLFRGKTRTSWRVRLTDSSLKIGDIVNVRITGTHSRELHGELATPVTVN